MMDDYGVYNFRSDIRALSSHPILSELALQMERIREIRYEHVQKVLAMLSDAQISVAVGRVNSCC